MQNNEALREAFERDGFVHLPGFMNAREIDALETRMNRVIRDVVPTLPKTVAMYEDYSRPETLKQLNLPDGADPYFPQLRDGPKLTDLVRLLLRDDVVPRQVEYFCKPPGVGKATPPHQDGYYFCLVPNEAATVWVALDDLDDENGTLHYLAGSHRKGVLPHGASRVLGFSQGLAGVDLKEIGREVVCRVRRGDALVHHSLTVHLAPGNTSADRLRRAVGFVYYAKRAQVDPEQQRRYQESLERQRREAGVI